MAHYTLPSPLIRGCGHLALLSLLCIPLSVLGVRLELLHYNIGLPAFIICCWASLLLLLILAVASLLPAYRGRRRAILSRSLAAVPGALLAVTVATPRDYPAIHDISTDVDNPPEFRQAVERRGAVSNSLEVKPESVALQLQAYPDLATIHSRLDPGAAVAHAADIARSLQWKIHNREGLLIEATHTSFWFGFVDDIAIRFRPTANGTDIDLRSVSRVGTGDRGANANRIRAFISAWNSTGSSPASAAAD